MRQKKTSFVEQRASSDHRFCTQRNIWSILRNSISSFFGPGGNHRSSISTLIASYPSCAPYLSSFLDHMASFSARYGTSDISVKKPSVFEKFSFQNLPPFIGFFLCYFLKATFYSTALEASLVQITDLIVGKHLP